MRGLSLVRLSWHFMGNQRKSTWLPKPARSSCNLRSACIILQLIWSMQSSSFSGTLSRLGCRPWPRLDHGARGPCCCIRSVEPQADQPSSLPLPHLPPMHRQRGCWPLEVMWVLRAMLLMEEHPTHQTRLVAPGESRGIALEVAAMLPPAMRGPLTACTARAGRGGQAGH